MSHQNSITKPRARFLLSLIEDLTKDFPSPFILSLIDVYRDKTTRDKLIFPSFIMRIIRHSSNSYHESPHSTVMCAISAVTVRRSEAQLRLKQPWIKTVTPPAPFAPSSSSSSSSFSSSSLSGGVTLKVVMAQLERMDAHLNTLTSELYKVNTCVSRIAR